MERQTGRGSRTPVVTRRGRVSVAAWLPLVMLLGCQDGETIPPAPGPTPVEESAADETTTPATEPLPKRDGPQQATSGSVPHVQLGIDPDPAVVEALRERAFSLPGVEKRGTIVSLPGAEGMWLEDDVPVINPSAIVAGREFAHIHPDGSLHAPLPVARAFEVEETGWGERHPWADQRDGWGGFVMLYTPSTLDELEVTFQLIVESYNYVTGRSLQADQL